MNMVIDKKKKIKAALALVVCFVSIFIFSSRNTLAASDAWIGQASSSSGSTGGGGGSCKEFDYNYREDCAGASWIFYEASDWLRKNYDTISEDTVVELHFPLSKLYNNHSVKIEVPLKACASKDPGSGFWHYGINGIGYSRNGKPGNYYYILEGGFQTYGEYGTEVVNDPTSNNWRSSYYDVALGSWGHWRTLSVGAEDYEWVEEKTTNNVNQTLYGYVKGELQPLFVANDKTVMEVWKSEETGIILTPRMVGSRTSNDDYVVNAYKNTFRYAAEKNGISYDPNELYSLTTVPNGVYGFCYSLSSQKPTFEAGTKVEWRENGSRDTTMVSANKTEGPRDGVVDLEVEVGQTETITFKQFGSVSKELSEVMYSVNRIFKNEKTGDEAGIEILNSGAISSGTMSKDFIMKSADGSGTYIPVGDDGIPTSLLNTNKYKVSFNEVGTYYLCESINMPSWIYAAAHVYDVVTTSACIRVKVNKSADSDIYGRSVVRADDKLGDTGTVKPYKSATATAIKKKAGESANILFSHYASEQKGVEANVKWKVGYISVDDGNADGFTINSRISNGTPNSSKKGSSGSVTLNGNSKTVYTDSYDITFNSEGLYVLCETLSLDGTAYTQACAKVIVTPPDTSRMAFSAVSGGGNEASTGEVHDSDGGRPKTASISLGSKKVGESVSFSFYHYGVSTKANETVAWKVTKSGSFGGSGVTLSSDGWSGNSKTGSDKMSASWMLVGYYSKNSLGLIDNTTYSATFTLPGNYEFCQSFNFPSGSSMTKVCASVTVTEDSELVPVGCDASDPNRTTVSSLVTNLSTGASGKTVYAKPNDNVQWSDCYYGGVQNKANEQVTVIHADASHDVLSSATRSTNTNRKISDVIPWANSYNVVWPNGTDSNSWANGHAVTKQTKSNEKKVEYYEVGNTLSDNITSSSPVYVTINNNGKHEWVCHPGSTQTSYGCYHYSYKEVYNGPQDWSDIKDSATCADYGGFWLINFCTANLVSPKPFEPKPTGYEYVCDQWYQDKCAHTNDYITYSVDYGPAQDSSSVLVPYNYRLTAGVKAKDDVIYAGETMSVDGWVNVETKSNSVTVGTYATMAKNAKTQLIAFVSRNDLTGNGGGVAGSSDFCSLVAGVSGKSGDSRQCATLENRSGQNFNNSGLINGTTNEPVFSSGYNAFDASAGDYICFAMGVYPYTSGSDTNMGDFNGDGRWYMSSYSCKVVAKKPTFQVHGAGLYSAGNIAAPVAVKRNMYPGDGYAAYTQNGSSARVFSSWTEQNLVLKGTTNAVASGSSSAGGSQESAPNFCKYRTPLSFANFATVIPANICDGSSVGFGKDAVGGMGSTTGSTYGVMQQRSNYVDYWLPTNTAANVSSGATVYLQNNYSEMKSASGVNIHYTTSSGSLNIGGSSISQSVTHIVKASGDITITGDINYVDGSLSSIAQVPKLIIYGNNIMISCSVKNIDAILIANKKINTCYNSSNVNDAARSNQLTIRGVTIADTILLNRTYGAATGNNSDIPAEIINYDASAILWGRHMSGASESGTLTKTYQHELAPRY